MTPEQKARQLIFKMCETGIDVYHAVDCAIILAKEMIRETGVKYWYDVKRELEKTWEYE